MRNLPKYLLAVAGVGLLGLVTLVLSGPGPEGTRASSPWQDAKVVALGQALYADHCAACHGADLEGAPDWQVPGPDGLMPAPPHDASGHTWHHADDLLVAITREGMAAVVGGGYESGMPGFGDLLDDAEIRAILAFIKSTWPPDIIAIHDRINDAARP